jgi:two-component sensor histidine kinase/PAS domain-containing protein
MSTLSDLLAEHTALPGSAVAHLQRLVSEWQLLADLSFSDLTVWVPAGQDEFACVAQVRPTTWTTVHADDLVSKAMTVPDAVALRRSWEEEHIVTATMPGAETVQREVIPVRHADAVVALLVRDAAVRADLARSALDTAYLEAADDLFRMVSDGTFPPGEQPGEMHTGPRAGDGLLRLDPDGVVVYVSPNALSAYHRLGLAGGLQGAVLAALTRPLIADPFDAAELAARITGAVQGRSSLRMEIEARGATVLFRALPLRPGGRAAGAVVLVRDVTEVRRRDRALLSKDATIREIHHRVKNNLQTVAALLRLQARRSDSAPVRHTLAESVRRVSSIALVHETLSTSADDRVDLDQIVDRLVPMLSDVAAAESPARVRRDGSFGSLSADLATPLVMVLAEIVQNALQHGYPPGSLGGEVTIRVRRSARELDVRVVDDGRGLPAAFSLERARGLGLQIVRTLVDSELGGSIGMHRPPAGAGTEVTLVVPLRGRN